MGYEEHELAVPAEWPIKAWRVFDLTRDGDGVAVVPPMQSPPRPWSKVEVAYCGSGHAAPQAQCRCGAYGVVEGQNEPLTGYPRGVVFAEVALSGRAFVDYRAVRAERAEVLRLVAPNVLLLEGLGPDEPRQLLEERYGVTVERLDTAPTWVVDTSYRDLRQGVDLDSLGL